MKNNYNPENPADERFVPRDFSLSFEPFFRHFQRYFTAVNMVGKLGKDELWLDCACGGGYGTNILLNFASQVHGFDVSKEAVSVAAETYDHPQLRYFDDYSLIEDNLYNVIFSIETIEHMPEENAELFLKRLENNLHPDGLMIISTPIVPNTNYNPSNPFHRIEYSKTHFVKMLHDNNFTIVEDKFVKTTFTDGETKFQGYFLCKKQK